VQPSDATELLHRPVQRRLSSVQDLLEALAVGFDMDELG
jgi:hypothetical protein